MKFLFDLFPVLCFFAVYWLANIYAATVAAIVATIAQVTWLKLRRRRVEPRLWVSLAIIVVFGGMTLYLDDPAFIKWKPSILYWAFAVALTASAALFGRNLIKAAMSGEMPLPEHVWSLLNWSWVAFFVLMGIANYYIAFSFSYSWCAEAKDVQKCASDLWVNFKLFGGVGLMVLFVIGQALVLARYLPEEGGREGKP
jgi:intracellular septation protein